MNNEQFVMNIKHCDHTSLRAKPSRICERKGRLECERNKYRSGNIGIVNRWTVRFRNRKHEALNMQ
jgi:hypothetical protein